MECKMINLAIVLIFFINISNARLSLDDQDLRRPFDQELYRDVLDPVACRAQVSHMIQGNPALMLRFLDAGVRFPRSFLQHNMVDLGNYRQCLGINEKLNEDMRVEGKYCMIQLPTDQNIHWPQLLGNPSWLDDHDFGLDEVTQKELEYAYARIHQARAAHGLEDFRSGAIGIPPTVLRLAVCIPKPCAVEEAIAAMIFNVSAVGFKFEEEFCRLPNDKSWMAVDTIAIFVFSLIGFLTLLSTGYDLYHTLILTRDPKSLNPIYTSFSVYTNTHRLFTFKTSKGALECLDGIRVISMMWIIAGHTFMMLFPFLYNVTDVTSWMTSAEALWVTTAPIGVDSFFMIGGVLLVYTTVGKMTGMQLISKLHLFYLNRLLRMFPALAAIVLLEASVFFRMADGPVYNLVARNAQRCRSFWWSTLLHVQNYVNPEAMCIGHSWYIAIDIQLYIVSPLVLFWVLSGSKKSAWTALTAGLLTILTASTIYNFIMKFPGGTIAFRRLDENEYFLVNYYYNTLTRGTPFFVGMIYGYVLHLCRGTEVKLNLVTVSMAWLVALAGFALPFYTTYRIKQFEWDNQTLDSMVNSFQRSLWAAALGWLIFACVHGYGGPINWLLSLQMWKLPSRLSYAMYLYHFSQMFIYADMTLSLVYFSVPSSIYNFISQFTLTLMVSLVVAVLIEAPFSTLFKVMLDKAPVKPKPKIEDNGTAQKNEVMP